MSTGKTPKLEKFPSETLQAFYVRASIHFRRHKVSELSYQSYDFLTGLADAEYRRLSQVILPKTIENVTWEEIKLAIDKIETQSAQKSRLQLASLQRRSGQSIQEFADEVNALSLNCNWDAVSGGEAVRQLKFLTAFTEPHILEALLEMKDTDKFDQMVQKACAHQLIHDNSRMLNAAQVVAPVQKRPVQASQPSSSGQGRQRNSGSKDYQGRGRRRGLPRCPDCFKSHQPPKCPYIDVTCPKCSFKGHLPTVCRTTSAVDTEKDRSSPSPHSGEGVCPSKSVIVVPILGVASLTPTPFSVNVKIKGFPRCIPFLVDTGSSVTLLDVSFLPSNIPMQGLMPYVGRVSAANGRAIVILGILHTRVVVGTTGVGVSILIAKKYRSPGYSWKGRACSVGSRVEDAIGHYFSIRFCCSNAGSISVAICAI